MASGVVNAVIQDNFNENAEDRGQEAFRQSDSRIREGRQGALEAYQPYEQFGRQAIGPLSALVYGKKLDEETGEYIDISPEERLSSFQASPDYQFRLQEGQSALEASQAARGGLFSGRAGIEAQQFGQNTASGEYNTYLDRLQSLMMGGQNAATGIANVNTGAATALSNNAIGSGQLAAQALQQRGQLYGDAYQETSNKVVGMASSVFGAGAGAGGGLAGGAGAGAGGAGGGLAGVF